MDLSRFHHLSDLLDDVLGPDLITFNHAYHEATVRVYAASITRVLTLLRDHHECYFKQLIDITAVDYPQRPQRFEVVYHVLSHQENQRLRVKIDIDEGCTIPSITPVFECANWYEREVWDMFGIIFSEHPDMRRILTDYSFSGHPLRKDFPVTGFTQVRYCEKEKRIVTEPVSLTKEYRSFDFVSPWNGPSDGVHPHTKDESV
jgi:NADH-quinone oxidoreductase subunit C